MDDIKKILVKVSYYYYKMGLTQGEIAERLKMSRQRVNRLLKRVRDEGIVTININGFNENYVDLESKIEEKYNLNRAIIVPAIRDFHEVNLALGIAGADYITSLLHDNLNIGMAWGNTLFNIANSLADNTNHFKNISVIQVVGSLNEDDGLRQSDEITRITSNKLNATPYFLFAPTYVDNINVKMELMKEESINNVFQKMSHCDVMLYSVGEVNAYYSAISRVIKIENYDEIIRSGGVGNIGLRFFDKNGNFLDSKINEKVMGIDIDTIKKIPDVICVAGHKRKVPAIVAALKGGLMTTLITDNITAKDIVDYK
ncbi:helix-turn-helix domain-containing protein [Alkalibaculum sp. M08DMB]|uniref:Helix-turn-helix domain-containing protein n=1 Tax=Alkalibaculum sporogenes TaxID=2655001 RepID=A0A6A7K7L6_9FIRM|nr:sugar-binding transcriptional regulator [Alkalibaculum sporogenes]MPW25342.1 helix-turn-helix domain-containing protein [Alkalibaculum sporogenes]